jgi:hypothetical protein
MIQAISSVDPLHFALLTLGSATLFTILFFFDSITHVAILKEDITDKELQTHRLILLTSIAMEGSLILFYWSPWLALPIFLACFITRTAHEFIDELHYHVGRCKPREHFIHLGMWVFVLIKTLTLFIWGFFTQYKGVLDLPWYIYAWTVLVFAGMLYVSKSEWGQRDLKKVVGGV